MSRRIEEKHTVVISGEESALRKTDSGKLLFTKFHDKNGVFLLQKDRLTVAAFPDESRVGAIYLAKVADVVKNIEACFVEIQPGELCFLPFRDAGFPFLVNRVFDGRVLEGDQLLVQIVRDAQKSKQPSVTAQISLADDYFALTLTAPTPHIPSARQPVVRRSSESSHPLGQKVYFSRKLDEKQKDMLERMLFESGILREGGMLDSEACLDRSDLDTLPVDLVSILPFLSLTVRTRAAEFADGSAGQLAAAFRNFMKEYLALFHTALHRTCFSCLKRSDTAENIMTELLSRQIGPEEFSEIVTDDSLLYSRLAEYAGIHLPGKGVRLYEDSLLPLSKLYGLEGRIEEAAGTRVWLKSGGYLMIQPTEALTVIDVNSGRYEGKKDAFVTVNLEAAEEIARQLRLRNLSGIIIVDFINMEEEKSRAEVMEALKKSVRRDKVRTVVVDMTPLGLVEITRKRITKPLAEML